MSEASNPQTEPRAGLKVLVVDDDRDCARTLSLLIRLLGYQVDVAHTGAEAVEKVRTLPPDVVFLDIGMPGMSGYEVARKLRGNGLKKEPLLIAVTGLGRDEDRKRSEEAGIHLHLIKPVDPEELTILLRRFQKVVDP